MQHIVTGLAALVIAFGMTAAHAQKIEIGDKVGIGAMQIAEAAPGGGLLTRVGKQLRLTAQTKVIVGKSTLAGKDARQALTPGTTVRVIKGHRAGGGAVVVERMEILPQ